MRRCALIIELSIRLTRLTRLIRPTDRPTDRPTNRPCCILFLFILFFENAKYIKCYFNTNRILYRPPSKMSHHANFAQARPPSSYVKSRTSRGKNRRSIRSLGRIESIANRESSEESSTSDSSNSSSSSSNESSFYQKKKAKRPSEAQTSIATKELGAYGVRMNKQIGKGSYGTIYLATFQKSLIVVKLTLFRRTPQVIDSVTKLKVLLHRNLCNLSKRKRSPRLRREQNEQQFFTEDYAFRSHADPELMYHIMEYLPGQDLLAYFKACRNITFETVMKIFCSLLQAMQFFHSAGVLFNDLKLENVIVCPKTKRVSLIDYIDSSTGCRRLECDVGSDEDEDAVVSTFADKYNDVRSKAEDVFRVALTMLDAIALLTGLFEESDYETDYPASVVKDGITRDGYPTATILREVTKCTAALKQTFSLSSKVHTSLTDTLLAMLAKRPEQRPSIRSVLRTPPFDICLKRTPYTMKRMVTRRRDDKRMVRRLRRHILLSKKRLRASKTHEKPSAAPHHAPAADFFRDIISRLTPFQTAPKNKYKKL
jgi:serine/threonine protein kinase